MRDVFNIRQISSVQQLTKIIPGGAFFRIFTSEDAYIVITYIEELCEQMTLPNIQSINGVVIPVSGFDYLYVKEVLL